MGLRKWLMKQYWRLVQVRGIWNLFYGVLLLAVAYYLYLPFFAELDVLGPFLLASLLMFAFLIVGYLYDRVFVMWAPELEVQIERDPFQYVPHPRDRILWFPLYSTILDASQKILEAMDVDTSKIQETREYYAKLEQLSALRRADIDKAIQINKDFIQNHPYLSILKESDCSEDKPNYAGD